MKDLPVHYAHNREDKPLDLPVPPYICPAAVRLPTGRCRFLPGRGNGVCFIPLPEDDPAPVDDDFSFADRFGIDAVVETDTDGEPVAVNGYPTHRVRAGFNNLGQTESFQTVIDFVDYPFWQSAAQYDGNLAVMSLMMAGCANRAVGFRDIPKQDFDPALNLVHFLSDAGFSDIRKDDYSKVPTMFTVSTAMGHREMRQEGKSPSR